MKTEQLFSVAGVSTSNGETKIRFANDPLRIKVLAKNGHTDIKLVELAHSMSKKDAVVFLQGLNEFSNSQYQQLFFDFLSGARLPKATKPKATKPKATKPKAVEVENEDNQPIGYNQLMEEVGEALI